MSDDSKIIDLFFARDEQAIVELSEKYGAVCKIISKNILKNELDAEECVSDTYLALWNRIPPERPEPLRAYVIRIIRNISIAKYHANTSLKRNSYYDTALDELEECISDCCTIEDEIDADRLAMYLNNFIESLDKESRIMFMCRYWCSDSVSDIARMFGIRSHTVSVRLFRIREKLKEYLSKEGVDV